uniref:Pentatricopeptide repeat-containing protein n=1 Tax=Kalanchoe fedtschenkoi TaxID=63787 RepID=A0A7N0T1V7_KALFE
MNQPLRSFSRQVCTFQLPDSLVSSSSLLQLITDPGQVNQFHAALTASGLSNNVFASNNLINAYTACGLSHTADAVFRRLVGKNVVSWTILISGSVKAGSFLKSVELFREMVATGVRPNAVAVSSVLPAFGNLGFGLAGRSVHGYWVRLGWGSNVFVETALVDMYGKFGLMDVARNVFDEMRERNAVTWNAIISAYSDNGCGAEAIRLFISMRRVGCFVDCYTITGLVSACWSVSDARFGDGVHSFVIRAGFESDLLVKTSLLQFYVNVLSIDDAYVVFNEISDKDVVVWTLMLNGFAAGGYYKKAREHFTEMLCVEDLILDPVVYMAILSSCRDSGALMQGRRIHGMIIKDGFEGHVYLGSSLIDLYSNSGQLEDSRRMFEGVERKDAVCWNAMIHGLGMNGLGSEAIDLFYQMNDSNVSPDDSTVVHILSACSHSGMVSEGLEIFKSMTSDKNFVPKSEHYACVVDLLGRAGKLREALSFINSLEVKPGSEVYGALFSACRTHDDFELGVETVKQLFDREQPADLGFYSLLLNFLSQVGNWADMDMIRSMLKSKAVVKDPGFSSIELNQEVYTFMAGDSECPPFSDIDDVLKPLAMQSRSR